ncbi:hypothetical protein [Saccharopolyspora sp. NPDC002686]|uniref:hypothetical protein n=1 Tax=Saccharopolyspora sp. NPDC002686 TaxID=3154541 RepID=UPI0033335A57
MLATIGLLSTTFGVSVASALIPVISVEVFAIGVVLNGTDVPWWLLAAVIAAGQIGGKLLHFYAARGAIKLPGLFRSKDGSEKQPGRWRRWLEKFRTNCQRRPLWTAVVMLLSAALSVPPYAAVAVIAGWAKVSLSMFLITGFVGRFVRFGALAIAPAMITTWI